MDIKGQQFTQFMAAEEHVKSNIYNIQDVENLITKTINTLGTNYKLQANQFNLSNNVEKSNHIHNKRK
jgi:hypothetical protein